MNGYKPLEYLLKLDIDQENLIASGEIIIALEKINESNDLLINVWNNLEILKVSQESKVLNFEKFKYFIQIQDIEASQISILFRSPFSYGSNGLFLNNNIVITQLESIYASTIFPCFDSPEYRCPISLELTVKGKQTAIASAPMIFSETKNDKTKYIFRKTEPIQINIFAFSVGTFFNTKAPSKYYSIEIYSIEEMSEYSKLVAGDIGMCADWMTEFTKKKLPLEELKYLIVQSKTGMENWGLIIYGPSETLSNPSKAKTNTLHDALDIFAHETAHLWMGDMVSIKWFSHLWIKEGFATLIPFYIIDSIHPEWNRLDKVFSKTLYYVFDIIDRNQMDPIVRDVEYDCLDIESMYGVAAYQMGSCVYRMVIGWIGIEAFRECICKFISKNYFKTVTTSDLIEAFKETCGDECEAVFNSFLTQNDYPIIELTDELEITQRSSKGNPNTKWTIPLRIEISKSCIVEEKVIILKPDENYKLEAEDYDFVKLNKDAMALARVKYGPKQFFKLCEAVKQGKIGNHDVGSLINETIRLLERGVYDREEGVRFVLSLVASTAGRDEQFTRLEAINALGIILESYGGKAEGFFPFFVKNAEIIKERFNSTLIRKTINLIDENVTIDEIENIMKNAGYGKKIIKKARYWRNNPTKA